MRGRSVSEQRWLRRQQTDPFVAAAAKDGYRSRSAYKLAAIDDRHDFLRRSHRIVDLGAAPGGWLQVAVARAPTARIVALDLLPLAPVGSAIILEGDAFAAGAAERLRAALGGPADAVLSDMAPPATGHRATDQLRSLALAEAAVDCARSCWRPAGPARELIRGQGEQELIRTTNGLPGPAREAPASRPIPANVPLRRAAFDAARKSPSGSRLSRAPACRLTYLIKRILQTPGPSHA